MLMALLLWCVATTLVWAIGVRRFHYTSSYPELLRTLGFAAAPLLADAPVLPAFEATP